MSKNRDERFLHIYKESTVRDVDVVSFSRFDHRGRRTHRFYSVSKDRLLKILKIAENEGLLRTENMIDSSIVCYSAKLESQYLGING